MQWRMYPHKGELLIMFDDLITTWNVNDARHFQKTLNDAIQEAERQNAAPMQSAVSGVKSQIN